MAEKKNRPIDPLELAKVVPPKPVAPDPAPAAQAPQESPADAAAAEPSSPPVPAPAGPPLPRYRVLEDRCVSLGAQMAWMRKGKVVSDEMRPGIVAVLRAHEVPLEELPPER